MLRLCIVSALTLFLCEEIEAQHQEIVELENDFYELKIQPGIGGRIVHFSTIGGENILLSDPSTWNEPLDLKPKVRPHSKWKAYNGHIVWLGPQSDWWQRQNLNKKRKRKKLNWPPDPYIIYGDYPIYAQTDTTLEILGPSSPISGVALVKKFELDGDKVIIKTEMINTTSDMVSWDIWNNTRVKSTMKSYIPANAQQVKMDTLTATATSGGLPWYVNEGFFHFDISETSQEVFQNSKVYIAPAQSYIASFNEDLCFMIDYPFYKPEDIHPDQSLIEIYLSYGQGGALQLQELEIHSKYVWLAPGESYETEIVWRLLPYSGEFSPEGHLKFLEGINK